MSTIVDAPIPLDGDNEIKVNHHNSNKLMRHGGPLKPPKTVIPLTLSAEQEKVQKLVLDGKSVFYTGSAGTGKSILLRSIIKSLKNKYKGEEGAVAVTASTGLAAVNISGTTLHSFAGIGLGKEPYQDLVKKIKRSKKSLKKWRNCKVLVIDEISMISGELFDKLDNIACSLRRTDDPFGGIQIVACGDFFQLPPVIKDDDDHSNRFCFNSNGWQRTMELSISLTTVFRQKGDLEFIRMLNEMRLGRVDDQTVKNFKQLERELPIEDGIIPAELFPTRFEVERANNCRLKSINLLSEVFYAIDGGTLQNQEHREKLLMNFMAPERLELKKGAQVMMIKNIDESLVNGSLGRVVDFLDSATYLAYKQIEEDHTLEDELIWRRAMTKRRKEAAAASRNSNDEPPLDITADFIPFDHDDDAISSDNLDDSVFEFLNEIETNDEEANSNILRKKKLIKTLQKTSRGKKLPLVKFLTPDGTSRTILVTEETWTVDDEKGDPLVSRMQIPLILAWSLSIHKSQGQTLTKVKVNLGKVFEKGQAYVALSRAVSRDGLQVLNFNRDKVFVHQEVLKFYENLKDVGYYLDKERKEKEKKVIDTRTTTILLETDQNEYDDEDKIHVEKNGNKRAKIIEEPDETEIVIR